MSQHHPSTPPRSDSAPAPRPTQSIAELYAAIAKSRGGGGTPSPGTLVGLLRSATAAVSPVTPSPLAALLGPIAAAAAAASAASHSAAAFSSSAIAATAAAHFPSSADRPPLQFSSASHDEFSRANKHSAHSSSNAVSPAAGAGMRTPARAASAAAAAAASPRPSPPASGSPATAATAAAGGAASSVFSTVGVYRSPLTSRPLVRTLVVALLALVGSRVKIDLRNECTVRGMLESVDKQGNMALVQASTQRPGEKNGDRKSAPSLEFMFLPARSVRFVHIPTSLGSASALLSRYEQRMDSNLLEYQRKKRLGRYTSREAQLKNVAKKEERLAREIAAEEAAAAAAAAAADDPVAVELKKEETKRKQRESMAGSTWRPPSAATSTAIVTAIASPAAVASSSAAASAAANPPEEDASNKRRKI